MAKYLPVDGYYGRWYRRDGRPIHETDIRTARKEGLIPGVSVIARVMAMPDLDRLQCQISIDANPRTNSMPGPAGRRPAGLHQPVSAGQSPPVGLRHSAYSGSAVPLPVA